MLMMILFEIEFIPVFRRKAKILFTTNCVVWGEESISFSKYIDLNLEL